MLNLRRNLESKENREEKQNRLGAEMNIRSGQGCFGGKAKVSTGSQSGGLHTPGEQASKVHSSRI